MLFQLNKLGNQGNSNTGGTLTLTQAGGEAFPVWNTVAGNDKVSRLSIYGKTLQIGTPAPDAPVEFQSAGDSGLILTVASARQGGSVQTFSFADIVLRSLPSGVHDEIVYENGVWKHIQRVFVYTPTGREGSNGGVITADNRITGWISVPAKTTTQCIISNRFIQDSSINTPTPQIGKITLHKGGGFAYVGLPLNALEPGNLSQWFADNPTIFLYPLDIPIETILNLPAIPTFVAETWFTTNQAEVKPRMSAEIKVKNAVRPAKSPLGQWDVLGRTNIDTNRTVLPDQSGNGNNFSLSGFGYIPGSGFNSGVLECDGVDDLATLTLPVLESSEKTIFMVLAPMLPPQTSIRAYTFLGAEICSLTPSGIVQFLSDSSAGYSLIQSPVGYYDYSKSHVLCFSRIGNNAKGYIDGNLIGENSDFRDKPWAQYLYIGGVATVKCPLNFIAAVLYNRMLSHQEIQQTNVYLQQKYGL